MEPRVKGTTVDLEARVTGRAPVTTRDGVVVAVVVPALQAKQPTEEHLLIGLVTVVWVSQVHFLIRPLRRHLASDTS